MKPLAHKVIIYDDVCPMCKAYTQGFVRIGWLPAENRVGLMVNVPTVPTVS